MRWVKRSLWVFAGILAFLVVCLAAGSVWLDSRAGKDQKEALVKLAKKQGADLIGEVVAVESATVELEVCLCKEGGCARLNAGKAKIETRCINAKHDKMCGNESPYYEPLTRGVKADVAMATENSFKGKGIGSGTGA